MMRTLKYGLSALAMAAATAGVISFGFPELLRGGGAAPADAAQSQGTPPAMPVPITVVQQQTVPVYLEYVGSTEAIRQVTLEAKVSGYLARVGADDGADVKVGDLLYEIDPRDYQAVLDQANAKQQGDVAALEYAKFSQKRNAALSKLGVVARDTDDQKTSMMHQAQASLLSDEAAIRAAHLNLDYTEIRAPYVGRLGRSLVHEGALITAQQTELNTLVQLSPIYVTFNPNETDLDLIARYRRQEQLTVDIMVGDGAQPRYSGTLTFLDNTVDRNTGTITARATIDNPNEELLPGQYVQVRLHLTDRPDALLVPQVALASSQLGRFVYVATDNGTAEQRFIETGALIGDQIVVKKGLQPGDKVITGNLQKIGPGAPVQPLPTAGRA